MRKGKYLLEKFGELGCVGCGRCIRACVAKINIVDGFNAIREFADDDPRSVRENDDDDIHLCHLRWHSLVEVEQLTAQEKLFTIETARRAAAWATTRGSS